MTTFAFVSPPGPFSRRTKSVPLPQPGRRLRVRDLDVLDPVEDAGVLDRAQAALVAAEVPHGTLLVNVAVAAPASRARRTRR
jgi:hypothetical protein